MLGPLLASRSAAGLLVRRLLPVTVGLPILVGVLRLEGERAGFFDANVGHGIMVALGILVGTSVLLWTAASAEGIDRERRRAEEELRRSREHHRALASNFPDGAVVLFDTDLRHLVAAGQGLAQVGLSSAAMEGRTVREVFPADVCAAIEPPYRAALEGSESTFEYRYRDRTYLVRVVPVRDETTGAVWGGATMVRDITERRQQESELERSRALLAEAQEIARLGAWEWRLDTGAIAWSDELYRIVGVEPGSLEMTYETLSAFRHPDDDAMVEEVVRKARETGEPFSFEYRLVRADGSVRWMHSRGKVQLGEDGGPLAIYGTAQDITERREAEARLRDADERYRILVEQLPLVTYIRPLDLAEANMYASPQVEEMLGYPAEAWQSDPDLLGRIVHPDDRGRVLADAADVRRDGAPTRSEYRYVRPDGRIVWVQDETYLVHDDAGTPVSVQGYLLDITERKRAEDERDRLHADLLHARKLEAVGQLAGGVAHEFNNMLMAITGHSTLVLDRLRADDPLRRDVQQVVDSAERAGGLTRQLLAFGRKQVMQPKTIDLNEVVSATVAMLRPLLAPGIELETVLDPGLPPTVADPAQIEQVIVNLVLNARDAIAESGSISIATRGARVDREAAAREEVPPGEYVAVSVADDGSGMDAETRSKIFEPFFTTKPVGKGTGLGLATVYGIVRQGGGFLTVDSEPGRGTIIDVFVGLAETRAAGDAEAAGFRGRAIVADDEEVVREVCAQLLARMGYRVETAADGVEALDLVTRPGAGVDLLLTDVVMPELDGPELARRVLAVHPRATVIHMSGYPGEQLDADAGGDVPFLQKPFTAADLERALGGAAAEIPPAGSDALTCVVADDHPAVLDAACRYLESRGVRVVARCGNADDAVAQVARLRPRVAVLDVSLPGLGGLDAAGRLRELAPGTRILLYTGRMERELATEALRTGVNGVVLKSSPLAELARAIGIADGGGIYVDPLLTGALVPDTPEPPSGGSLTERERQVLRLLAEGQTNDQVGKLLAISPDTVQTHVRNAMRKLGAESRTQAVATAMRLALIS